MTKWKNIAENGEKSIFINNLEEVRKRESCDTQTELVNGHPLSFTL